MDGSHTFLGLAVTPQGKHHSVHPTEFFPQTHAREHINTLVYGI